jgi:hypothetical protein
LIRVRVRVRVRVTELYSPEYRLVYTGGKEVSVRPCFRTPKRKISKPNEGSIGGFAGWFGVV